MIKHFTFFCILFCIEIAINTACAEKADSTQPLQIWANAQTYDGTKKITIYTGPVHVKKGTLDINANRLEVTEDSNGGKIGTLYGDPGKLVHYRQKRDGGPNLWAEGEAEKVIYNDTLERIKLFNQAKLVLLDGQKRTHESSGIYISYDSRTDFMSVNNTLDGVSKPNAGFTYAVIYPNEDTTKPDIKPTPPKTEPAPSPKLTTPSKTNANGVDVTPKKTQEDANE